MDYSQYMKGKRKQDYTLSEKRCMECGRTLEKDSFEKDSSYLYLQSFCSEKCKNRYVGKED